MEKEIKCERLPPRTERQELQKMSLWNIRLTTPYFAINVQNIITPAEHFICSIKETEIKREGPRKDRERGY
jgi:hypothetical protein